MQSSGNVERVVFDACLTENAEKMLTFIWAK